MPGSKREQILDAVDLFRQTLDEIELDAEGKALLSAEEERAIMEKIRQLGFDMERLALVAE